MLDNDEVFGDNVVIQHVTLKSVTHGNHSAFYCRGYGCEQKADVLLYFTITGPTTIKYSMTMGVHLCLNHYYAFLEQINTEQHLMTGTQISVIGAKNGKEKS